MTTQQYSIKIAKDLLESTDKHPGLDVWSSNLVACYWHVAQGLALARQDLTTAKAQYILPKMAPADWLTLENRVSDLKYRVDELEGLKEAISQNLSVATLLLK